MQLALISDVHGNLEALSSVARSIHNEGAEKVVFLGDIVGYGANPNECIDMLREITKELIAGNHDMASAGKTSIRNFNPLAKEAIEWTRNKLTKNNMDFLSSLPLKKETQTTIYVHSSPYCPEDWNYVSDVQDAGRQFKAFAKHACFIGHSHFPKIFTKTSSGEILQLKKSQIKLREGFRYIINTGSVGQPRDGNPLSSYGIYDTEKKEYRLVRVQYDISMAKNKIIAAGLPAFLAKRLDSGK